MDDERNEQIIVSDFDNDFWHELFDLHVINTRDCIKELDGMKICIYNEVYGQHNLPHLHAKYCDYEVSVKTNGEILIGNFPPKKAKMLKKWVLSEEGQRKITENRNEYHKDGVASFTLAPDSPYEMLIQKRQ